MTATVRYQGGTASTSFTVDAARWRSLRTRQPSFQGGAAGTFTVSTDSSPTATLTESGQLPTGVTFTDNGDGTATIAGTPPSQTGTFPITITAQNGVSPTVRAGVHADGRDRAGDHLGKQRKLVVGAPGTTTVSTSGLPAPGLDGKRGAARRVHLHRQRGRDGNGGRDAGAGTQGSYPLTVTASNGLTPATQALTVTVLDNAPTGTAGV